MTESARTIVVAHPGAELYGSDRVLLESISALVEGGWRTVVAVPERGPLIRAALGRGAEVVLAPTAVIRKSVLSPRGLLTFVSTIARGLPSALRILRRTRATAVYVNTVTIPLWVLAARIMRVPVVTHVHEGESSAPALLRRAMIAPLLFSNRVIANSRFSIGVLERSIRSVGRRAVLVHNGVEAPDRVVPARTSLDGLRVCYVGRLSPRKGVDVAVDAVALLRDRGVDVRLDLVGSVFRGYEWYEEELHTQVERLGLGDRVRFHGFRNPVWPIVAESDVVVVPSRADEPFGDTAVEAIMAGRPVVASATSGLLEATDGYPIAQTVVPGDPTALADALIDVIDRWAVLRVRTQESIDSAAERHGPEVYRQRVRGVISELVGIRK